MTDTATAPSQPVATEIDVGTAAPAPSPMRKVIVIALGALLLLFVYHVLSDRYTERRERARTLAVSEHSWQHEERKLVGCFPAV